MNKGSSEIVTNELVDIFLQVTANRMTAPGIFSL